MKRFLMSLLLLQSLYAETTIPGTLVLWNDSPYILTATIQASDGTFLGQLTVQPGEQRTYTTKLAASPYSRPGAPVISLTPYRVIWQCPSEGMYSMCTDVSPGGLVRANDCRGNRFCDPNKEKEGKKPSSSIREGGDPLQARPMNREAIPRQ